VDRGARESRISDKTVPGTREKETQNKRSGAKGYHRSDQETLGGGQSRGKEVGEGVVGVVPEFGPGCGRILFLLHAPLQFCFVLLVHGCFAAYVQDVFHRSSPELLTASINLRST
jgi:hypothetical protein